MLLAQKKPDQLAGLFYVNGKDYRAMFTARFSRITVTLIWPG